MRSPISPYEFLKSRRPDEFSDSIVVREAQLNRDFFEFYLESLTNRSEEKKFEIFCKRMAEYELCPNLLTQTGPTGGGDSKVDSETYPVSEHIASTWYGAIAREAAQERWAFAISAKRDWKPKVKSDVQSIISTDRGYKKIFFMSNQYIPDKKRAATEDELSKQHDVDVRIIDRSWLIDKLFNNGRQQVAVDVFGLSDSFVSEKKFGPLDYERQQELDEIELKIVEQTSHASNNLALVENMIQSAVLSRELELPYEITMGRFERASTFADKHGSIIQRKDCTYQWAWTLYWWYQENNKFYEKYCAYENLILGSINFFDLERLTNLWLNLFAITGGKPQENNFQKHTDSLISEYKRFIEDSRRPNAALEARANFVFVKLMLADDADELFDELTMVIQECNGVLDFSLKTISKIIMDLSSEMSQYPSFDKLFETIVSLSGSREHELVTAKMLLSRGENLIESKPFSAIKYIGRAMQKLYKDESKEEFLISLVLLAHACDNANLLWASRGIYINAFFIGLTDYMKYGHFQSTMVVATIRLKMLELQHGRIPQSLEWYKLDRMVRRLFISSGYDEAKLQKIDDENLYDGILGMLVFKTPFPELHELALLPGGLEHHGLPMAAIALKYALGYTDEEMLRTFNDDEDLVLDFMRKWYDQPAKEQLPETPSFGNKQMRRLSTRILGCQVIFEADAQFPCIELSESILAALECFLSTAVLDAMFSMTPRVVVRVNYLSSDKFNIDFEEIESDSELRYVINCCDFNDAEFREAQNKTKEFILNFLVDLVAHIIIFKDHEQQIEKMIAKDLVLDRSLHFTGSIFVIADLFGKKTFSISDWFSTEGVAYPLRREVPLQMENAESLEQDTDEGQTNEKYTIKRGTPPKNVFDPEKVSPKDIEIISIINIPLWNKAKWKGVYFAWSPDNSPPLLAPLFSDRAAAISIFSEWRSLVGKADDKNMIKVGIIKGTDASNPFYYKVIFTANLEALSLKKKGGYISIPSRIHEMTVDNHSNLNAFETAIRTTRSNWKFILLPSFVDLATQKLELLFEYAIYKNHIEIKEAWEIGEGDLLAMAIAPGDNPIIPEGIPDAPINKLIKNRRLDRK